MRRTGLLVAVLALVVGACGGGGETVADGGEVTVVMTESQFDPDELRFAVGTTVTIVLRNDGEEDHEFMAGREVDIEDGIPHGFVTDFFDTVENLTIDPPDAQEMEMEGMGDESMGEGSDTTMGDMEEGEEQMEEMGVMVVRKPAETASITFTLTEASVGEWTYGCFEEDGTHWDEGMRGTIIVEEA